MHTIGAAFYDIRRQLQPLYDEREAASVAHMLLEHITGQGRVDRLMNKDVLLTDGQQTEYDRVLMQAVAGVPAQYITGKAWFMGGEYTVNSSVLIPRPETEELVQWVVADMAALPDLRILDVGTGSGCIPISLKRLLPAATVTSCDVSPGALAVAQQNAASMGVDVTLLQLDFLDDNARNTLGTFDVIVSNPPYIAEAERARLHINVSMHEPALALFVPDDDPLVFYRALAQFGRAHLIQGGAIYCELDAAHAGETKELFIQAGYEPVLLRKDMNDNNRMLMARKAD